MYELKYDVEYYLERSADVKVLGFFVKVYLFFVNKCW